MSLFEAEGLRKEFGGIRALDGATLSVDAGEVVGVMGPNGAGKTTFFDCSTGFTPVDSGTVRYDGDVITNRNPETIARRGMVRTFQLTRELTTLTVADNVKTAAQGHPGERVLPAIARTAEMHSVEESVESRATAVLDQFDLLDHRDDYAATLSGGQRKLLELARAVMMEPDLLLLDEPFAGVNPSLQEEIKSYIEELNDDGISMLIIEHEIPTLAEISDEIAFLHNGAVLARGSPETVLNKQEVIDSYMGAD